MIKKCLLLLTLSFIGCSSDSKTNKVSETTANTSGSVEFQMDAWVDNWFAAYLGENLLVEDSVSITTELSFNAETVTFNGDLLLEQSLVPLRFLMNRPIGKITTLIQVLGQTPMCTQREMSIQNSAMTRFYGTAVLS